MTGKVKIGFLAVLVLVALIVPLVTLLPSSYSGAETPPYTLTETAFSGPCDHRINDVYFTYNEIGYCYSSFGRWWDGSADQDLAQSTIVIDFSLIDGVTNVSCGLYNSSGTYYYTVWYSYGEKDDLDTYMSSGYSASCDAYADDLFVFDEYGGYSYTGDPSGWTSSGTPTLGATWDFDTVGWWDGDSIESISAASADIDGTTDVDCGLYYVYGPYKYTVWFLNGTTPSWGSSYQQEAFYPSAFAPTDTVYAYSGDPSGWSVYSGDNPPTITGTEDVWYYLNYSSGEGGYLDGNTSQYVLATNDGTAVCAVPNISYYFVNWSDSYDYYCRTEINVSANLSVTANFGGPYYYYLNYSAGSNGSVTGNTSQYVGYGGNGTAVIAVPDEGYAFYNWSDSYPSPYRVDFDVQSPLSVTANFVLSPSAYVITCFNSSGNWTVPTGVYSIRVLVVAGGGGGGRGGGGGGAGGLVYNSSYPVNPGSNISITVGSGGAGGVSYPDPGTGSNGSDSSFGSIVSIGGGGGGAGGHDPAYGLSGGSGGGGGAHHPGELGGSGTSGQGNKGGNSAVGCCGGSAGGGGGGFISAGGNGLIGGNGSYWSSYGGLGGCGINYSFVYGSSYGDSGWFAGGGGGAGGFRGGTGGNGGGGDGGSITGGGGSVGIDYTGGGGGAGDNDPSDGYSGGSGVVLIAYVPNPSYCHLDYSSGAHGYLTGNVSQYVLLGGNGTAVTAHPDSGYTFFNWTDSSGMNPRVDTGVSGNISVIANFVSVTGPIIIAFTTNTTWVVPSSVYSVRVLIVGAGGGGGSGYGGGGGGGGLIYAPSYFVTPGTNISITVGTGGIGGSYGYLEPVRSSTSGSDSIFDGVVAVGGGAGGDMYITGSDGGSGGGGGSGSYPLKLGGSGTYGQGHNGGTGALVAGGGGGGGALSSGGGGGSGYNTGGIGGSGKDESGPFGTSYGVSGWFAGGGGGAGYNTGGSGGSGGGGTGSPFPGSGISGTVGTGGGGGAGTYIGGNGSDGIVLVYFTPPVPTPTPSTTPGPTSTGVAPGTGVMSPPSTLSILSARVYEDFLEPGDQLYVLSYILSYGESEPTQPIQNYWDLDIYDGAVLKARGRLYFWGYRPSSVYLSPTSSLTWGGNYSIRLDSRSGMVNGSPSASYSLSSADWIENADSSEFDCQPLDEWCTDTAESIDIYVSTPGVLTVFVPGYGTMLTNSGGEMFDTAIPNLMSVCGENLFSIEASSIDTGSTPSEGLSTAGQTSLTNNFGTTVITAFNNLGQHMGGLSGSVLAGIFWFIIMMIVAGIGTGISGSSVVGTVVSLPILFIGNYLGVISLALMGVIGTLCVLYLLRQLWLVGQ